MAPPCYARIPVPRTELLAVMDAGQWMSATQICGRLYDRIPPECAMRHFRQRGGCVAADYMPTVSLEH